MMLLFKYIKLVYKDMTCKQTNSVYYMKSSTALTTYLHNLQDGEYGL